MTLIFVTGGARSGKSGISERVISDSFDGPVLYVATAEALDDEMARRVAEHRRRRPAGWRTLEARREVAAALRGSGFRSGAVLLDCLSLLVSNTLLDISCEIGEGAGLEDAVSREVEREMDGLFGWREGTGC
ncbi:MAG: bifunctional adenosylcobinamide kinase/adenosylcobinamide-phosphate guanylyltransferase, partial [Rubrobacteraceae bacterium]